MNDRDFCAILDEVEDPESSFNPLFSTLPVKQVQALTTEQAQNQGLSSQSQGIGFGHIFLIYLKYKVTK